MSGGRAGKTGMKNVNKYILFILLGRIYSYSEGNAAYKKKKRKPGINPILHGWTLGPNLKTVQELLFTIYVPGGYCHLWAL